MMESHALPQLLLGKRETTEVSSTGLSRSATKDTNRPTHATVHPYRASSCRDNLQRPVAPRRQGPRVPSPSHTGVFGPPPFCALPTLFESTSFTRVAVRKLSLRDASPGSESSPLSHGRF